MSAMKDYMMWLDDKGIATWSNELGELIVPVGTNIYAPELVDEYKEDEKWRGVELDDDDYIIDEEEELQIDDGDMDDCAWSPNDYWFHTDGGLTGDAMNFLYTLDSQGELV
jgi:hypothetical protein